MDDRYYEILRFSSQDEYYNAINDPEDELYDLLWDLFEKLVIEPAEVFDPDFRENNQFRYSIDSEVILEFFPEEEYFRKRVEPNPYRDESDAAGIHLQFALHPSMSCLFSVAFQVWGSSERQAIKSLWRSNRATLTALLHRCKPMVSNSLPYPALDHAESIEEMLDNYFMVKDPENFLAFNYPFAQVDEVESAQNFMVSMALLYHVIREYCQNREDFFDRYCGYVKQYFSGRVPELRAPLPCVEITLPTGAE